MSIQRRISMQKGFTLIELMVVIVIIGILAAIAIPKLFGMTAKAKASEVGPAVGTWSKLQQAFATEISTGGNFKAIGYTAPGKLADPDNKEEALTTNFKYTSDGFNPTYEDDTTSTPGWKATSLVKLNDCDKDKEWTAQFNAVDNKIEQVEIAGADFLDKVASGDCGTLTPQFGYLK